MNVCSDLAAIKSDPTCELVASMLLMSIGTSWRETLVIVVMFDAI
jgi:hypothetical protein